MSCIFKKHERSTISSNVSHSFMEYQSRSQTMSSTSDVSASELSYLKGQVWTLENRLREEKKSVKNIISSFKDIANEKYELLEELTDQKLLNQQIYEELKHERESNSVLMNEVECLQVEVDKKLALLEKVAKQNAELKESVVLANETIHQMGLMYLTLKERNMQ